MKIFLLFVFLIRNAFASPGEILNAYEGLLEKHKLTKNNSSFCFITPEGELHGHSLNKRMMPASITKAYTSYVALSVLSAQYRFPTNVYLDQNTIYFKGGDDGQFSTEHLFVLLARLNASGLTSVHKIVFDAQFFLNFFINPGQISAQLSLIMNTDKWDLATKNKYLVFKKKASSLGIDLPSEGLKFSAMAIQFSTENITREEVPYLSFDSAPLISHLKEMNVYSQNKYAFTLFKKINNPLSYNEYIWQTLTSNIDQVQIFEGSGGERNYTNCQVTVRMFQKLDENLKLLNLDLSDVLNVAPLEAGTLRNRFTELDYQGAVIAKTGTLENGVSTLGGAIETASGRVYFTILNHGLPENGVLSKSFEDKVVKFMIDTYGGKGDLQHKPWVFYPLDGTIWK